MNTNEFYQQGQQAYLNGLNLSHNPYSEDKETYAYDCWNNGYKSHLMPTKKQLMSDMNEEV